MSARRKFRLTTPLASEDDEHLALAHALSVLIAAPGTMSANGVAWFSIEHRNAASVAEGARRKARGVIPGVPDLYVRAGHRTLWIELKRGDGGVVSDAQKALHTTLRALGDDVAVCAGCNAALDQLAAWRVSMRGRISA